MYNVQVLTHPLRLTKSGHVDDVSFFEPWALVLALAGCLGGDRQKMTSNWLVVTGTITGGMSICLRI